MCCTAFACGVVQAPFPAASPAVVPLTQRASCALVRPTTSMIFSRAAVVARNGAENAMTTIRKVRFKLRFMVDRLNGICCSDLGFFSCPACSSVAATTPMRPVVSKDADRWTAFNPKGQLICRRIRRYGLTIR